MIDKALLGRSSSHVTQKSKLFLTVSWSTNLILIFLHLIIVCLFMIAETINFAETVARISQDGKETETLLQTVTLPDQLGAFWHYNMKPLAILLAFSTISFPLIRFLGSLIIWFCPLNSRLRRKLLVINEQTVSWLVIFSPISAQQSSSFNIVADFPKFGVNVELFSTPIQAYYVLIAGWILSGLVAHMMTMIHDESESSLYRHYRIRTHTLTLRIRLLVGFITAVALIIFIGEISEYLVKSELRDVVDIQNTWRLSISNFGVRGVAGDKNVADQVLFFVYNFIILILAPIFGMVVSLWLVFSPVPSNRSIRTLEVLSTWNCIGAWWLFLGLSTVYTADFSKSVLDGMKLCEKLKKGWGIDCLVITGYILPAHWVLLPSVIMQIGVWTFLILL